MHPSSDMLGTASVAFGWSDDLKVSVGPRGALGQMWRIDIGAARYALKEIFDEPPTEASIHLELDFIRRATAFGVRAPASHADRDGRCLVTLPAGSWLRCYDWLDLQPAPARTPDTPRRLGALLANMHRCAPTQTAESDGEPPYGWYDLVPLVDEWDEVAAESSAAGAWWTQRLADVLEILPQLGAAACPVDPKRLLLCHRDLHPENVFDNPAGELVVVDFDDMGPAEPAREFARAAFDWFSNETTTDLEAIEIMVRYLQCRPVARTHSAT